MNTMRTISRVLVVATVAFVGSASAVSGRDYAAKGLNAANSAKFKVIFAHIGENNLAKNNHAGKAGLDTLGYGLDQTMNCKDGNLSLVHVNKDLAEHFFANYAIRVVGDKLDKAGINSESAAKAVTNLTGGLVDTSKAQTAIEYATHPEVLIVVGGILYGMVPSTE